MTLTDPAQSLWSMHHRTRPLTCLGDARELYSRQPSTFARAMPEHYVDRRVFRKWWEWEYIAECADLLGCLERGRTGVGLGVGYEPLMFHFASRCERIVATDLYSGDTDWKEARYDTVQKLYDSAPMVFPKERLEIRSADMRSLGVPDGSFDFAWSCSSIEHIPTLEDLVQVFRELARVLKPGGHAILTTEFCITETPYLLPHVNALDRDLFRRIVQSLGAFEVLGETDWSYNWTLAANAPRARRVLFPALVHGTYLPSLEGHFTGHMANYVGVSVICPVAFVLRRVNDAGVRVPDWKDFDLDPRVRDFAWAVKMIQQRKPAGVVERLKPIIEAGPRGSSMQFFLHVFRFYIEAMALDHHFRHADLVKAIHDHLLPNLPPGPLQDGDCLDLVGYLLHEAGDTGNSAEMYRIAALSPSTLNDHAITLAFGYLRSMMKMNLTDPGIHFVADIVVHLIAMGWPPASLDAAWRKGLSLVTLSRAQRKALHEKVVAETKRRESLLFDHAALEGMLASGGA